MCYICYEHYYQAINTKILLSRFDCESKNKDQEPTILGQISKSQLYVHKVHKASNWERKIKNKDQEPALRARAQGAQGNYVHKVHKVSNWERKIKDQEPALRARAQNYVHFVHNDSFFYFYHI